MVAAGWVAAGVRGCWRWVRVAARARQLRDVGVGTKQLGLRTTARDLRPIVGGLSRTVMGLRADEWRSGCAWDGGWGLIGRGAGGCR